MVIYMSKLDIKTKLNAYIRQTNWWKNRFVFASQFDIDIASKYIIVNVGSNAARFCFFYENVLGQNWSSGTQGLNMDYEILKTYHSCLLNSAIVLLPLCPFSLVAEYFENKSDKRNYDTYLKYSRILNPSQINALPFGKDIWGFLQSPIRYNRKAWKYLINDVEPDRRLEITDQHMMLTDLMQDAERFMTNWKAEFDITDLSTPLPEHLKEAMDKSVAVLTEMIDFLVEREYRPVIVLPPMTYVLYKHFPISFWQTYIYDGIKKLNRPNIQVLDYTADEKWSNSELYFNSLFMNLRGRKAFTKQVLKDVGLEK